MFRLVEFRAPWLGGAFLFSITNEHEWFRLGLHRYIVGGYIGFGKEPRMSRMTRVFEMTKHECFGNRELLDGRYFNSAI
jgi:hypothetical protein